MVEVAVSARGFGFSGGGYVDPIAALNRNALAADRADEPRVVRYSRRPRPEPVAVETVEQYEYEFAEREGLKIDAGMTARCGSKDIMPDCCAYHSALTDLGCVEFWDLARGREVTSPVPTAQSSRRRDELLCSRCESVGHSAASCPFKDDEETRRLARLRRERRSRKAAAA